MKSLIASVTFLDIVKSTHNLLSSSTDPPNCRYSEFLAMCSTRKEDAKNLRSKKLNTLRYITSNTELDPTD